MNLLHLPINSDWYFRRGVNMQYDTEHDSLRWLKGYIHSLSYYHHQIGSIHLSHCYHIFPWLCVWDVCYIIFYYLLHIHSGKTGNLFSLLLSSLWWVQIIGFILSWGSYPFVCTLHHLIIIIVQTYLKTLNLWNACQIYFVECVSMIRHILSVIHYTIRGAVCFQFTHFPCDDWENKYTLSYHHQIGSMNYYPLFRVRSLNNGVPCMSCCILILFNLLNIKYHTSLRWAWAISHWRNKTLPKTFNQSWYSFLLQHIWGFAFIFATSEQSLNEGSGGICWKHQVTSGK